MRCKWGYIIGNETLIKGIGASYMWYDSERIWWVKPP